MLSFRTRPFLTSSFECVDSYRFICIARTPAGFTERRLRLIKYQGKLERFSFSRNCDCKIRQLSIIASPQSIKMNQLGN